jgi:hypothetical protein
MNISSFLSGNFLTHLDLPQPSQTWTISKAEQKLVGSDTKICLTFAEFPSKPLGCNKTNLKRIATMYGLDAAAWTGQQLLVYRSMTAYGGKSMYCVRLVGPQQQAIDDNDMPTQAVDLQSAPAAPVQQQPVPAAVQQTPVAVPAPAAPVAPVQQAPVAAPAQTPWKQDLANQQNSPPNA